MPLRLFALDPADIQFILQSMGINDFFALSLCSEETKKIAKATNVKCVQFDSKMFNDHLTACATIEETPDTSVDFNVTLRQPGCVEIEKEGRDVQIWRKEGYSQDDFVAHFMYILSQDRIGRLHMSQLSSWELAEKIGRVVGHCNSLNFDQTVPITFVKRAMTLFNSLETVIKSTPFELSEVLSLNATSVRLMTEFRNSFIVKWEDLVHCNVKHLTIFHVDISEKTINRFMKLWMKSCNQFYQPITIKLHSKNQIRDAEIFRKLKHESVNGIPTCTLIRADGKKLKANVYRLQVNLEIA